MPEDARTLYGLGLEALERGDDAEALSLFRRSLAEDPHFKAHQQIAMLLRGQGLADEAGKHLAAGYALNPSNDRLGCDFADWCLANGDVSRARELVDEVLRRNGTYGPARALAKRLP